MATSDEAVLQALKESAERDGKILAELGDLKKRVTANVERLDTHSERARTHAEIVEDAADAVDTGQHRIDTVESRLAQKHVELQALREAVTELTRSAEDRKADQSARRRTVGAAAGLVALIELVSRLLEAFG